MAGSEAIQWLIPSPALDTRDSAPRSIPSWPAPRTSGARGGFLRSGCPDGSPAYRAAVPRPSAARRSMRQPPAARPRSAPWARRTGPRCNSLPLATTPPGPSRCHSRGLGQSGRAAGAGRYGCEDRSAARAWRRPRRRPTSSPFKTSAAKLLCELKKIKLAWPGLNYATAPGMLILHPSDPRNSSVRATSASKLGSQIPFAGPRLASDGPGEVLAAPRGNRSGDGPNADLSRESLLLTTVMLSDGCPRNETLNPFHTPLSLFINNELINTASNEVAGTKKHDALGACCLSRQKALSFLVGIGLCRRG